jgi:hypothetical protein
MNQQEDRFAVLLLIHICSLMRAAPLVKKKRAERHFRSGKVLSIQLPQREVQDALVGKGGYGVPQGLDGI